MTTLQWDIKTICCARVNDDVQGRKRAGVGAKLTKLLSCTQWRVVVCPNVSSANLLNSVSVIHFFLPVVLQK